jgi:hypothetical protein
MDPALALDVLEQVEALPEGSTGGLVFGAHGTVLVEEGRVCWATATGMRTRLTDLICGQSKEPVERSLVEAVYRRCQQTRTPLGEALVASRLVTPEGLHGALLQHTSEALMQIGASRSSAAWVPHRAARYDARYTFSPAELLVRSGAMAHPELATAAGAQLAHALAIEGAGVAFGRPPGWAVPMPVAEVRTAQLSLSELRALGRWAVDTLDICSAVAPGALVGATREDGQAIVAWPSGPSVLVALCDGPSALAGVIVRRARIRGRA